MKITLLDDIKAIRQGLQLFQEGQEIFQCLQDTKVNISDGSVVDALTEAKKLMATAHDYAFVTKMAVDQLLDPKTRDHEIESLLANAQLHGGSLADVLKDVQALVGAEFSAVHKILVDHEQAK